MWKKKTLHTHLYNCTCFCVIVAISVVTMSPAPEQKTALLTLNLFTLFNKHVLHPCTVSVFTFVLKVFNQTFEIAKFIHRGGRKKQQNHSFRPECFFLSNALLCLLSNNQKSVDSFALMELIQVNWPKPVIRHNHCLMTVSERGDGGVYRFSNL